MTATQKHTIAALVENKPGVLNRIASLFRRRNFNIDSLTVGRTHNENLSRMTIVIDAQRTNARRVVSNLLKLLNVVDVKLVSEELHVSRDLALIKIRSDDAESRNSLTLLCERYPARIVDIGPKYAITEITATEEMVEEFIQAASGIGIVEMVRTGVVAMGRGTRIFDAEYEPLVPQTSNGKAPHVY
jgi:acetolactate synthase I/III small subunit